MSPFLKSQLHDEEELARDMGRLATVMFSDEVRILGGEPLLNPRIVTILKAARASGIAERVVLTTNGLLLHTMTDEFWAAVDEVRVNLYPGARPTERLIEQARRRAEESGTQLIVSEYSSFRVTMVTEPHPPDATTKMIFRTCKNAHLYHCHLVREGRLYKCACPSYLDEFLGKTGRSGYRAERDAFAIHTATDLGPQLWEFLNTTQPLDACRHCLGYVGEQQAHHQITIGEAREGRVQPVTRKTHLSKSTLARESLRYFGRRGPKRSGAKAGGSGRFTQEQPPSHTSLIHRWLRLQRGGT